MEGGAYIHPYPIAPMGETQISCPDLLLMVKLVKKTNAIGFMVLKAIRPARRDSGDNRIVMTISVIRNGRDIVLLPNIVYSQIMNEYRFLSRIFPIRRGRFHFRTKLIFAKCV